jgi:hypothetical protein
MNIDHSFELGHNTKIACKDVITMDHRLTRNRIAFLWTELRTAPPVRGLGDGFFLNANASIQEICNTIDPHVFI